MSFVGSALGSAVGVVCEFVDGKSLGMLVGLLDGIVFSTDEPPGT